MSTESEVGGIMVLPFRGERRSVGNADVNGDSSPVTISHNKPDGQSQEDLHARGIDIFRTGFAMRTVEVE